MQTKPTGCYILSSGGDALLYHWWGEKQSNDHFIMVTFYFTKWFEPKTATGCLKAASAVS